MAAPGIVRPLANSRGWRKGRNDSRTIEEKRESVIRGIERWLRKEKGAACLEQFDPSEGAPVIRVLYASKPLPVFNGSPFAIIDPACDRDKLWAGVIDEIRGGAHDRAIAEVARSLASPLEKRRARLKAA